MGQRKAGMAARGGERCACQHEADRIGQTQAARRERHQDREAKQAQRAKEEGDFHALLFSGAPWKEEPRGPRYSAAARSAPAHPYWNIDPTLGRQAFR